MNNNFFICLIFFLTGGAFANESYFQLRSLKNASIRSFNIEKLGRPTIFMVFQPNCTVCLRQITEFKCIEKKYDIILVGAFGLESELRKEYFRMKRPYQAYLANNIFLEKLNLVNPVTPQLLVVNNTIKKQITGLSVCENLNKI